MHKELRYITSLLCGASLLGAGIGATAKTQIDFNMANRQLEIYGEIEDGKSAYATFSVFAADADITAIGENSPELDNALYKTVRLADDGSFTGTIVLPEKFKGGEYALRTYGSDLEGINYFVIPAGTVSVSDLSGINNAGDAAQVLEAVKALEKIPFDSASLEKYGKAVSEYIYSQKPSGGYDGDSLAAAYYNGLALARTEKGDITAEEALLKYCAYCDVDYDSDYLTLMEAEKQTLQKLFTQSHGVDGSFGEIYSDLAATAKMINASSFEDLQKKYLAYAGDNGVSLKDYNSLSTDYSRDKVFMSVYSSVDKANSMADITAIFNSAVDKESDSSSGGSSGGSGGGGGRGSSGSSSGGATYIPVDTPVSEAGFTDTAGHWAEEYILTLKKSGIVNGNEDRSFRPDSTVSRAEFVKMICVMLGISPESGSQFDDVQSNEWFYGYVYGAYNAGIINGTSENGFSPYSPVTRQDAAVIINRACTLAGGGQISFADSGDIAGYASEAVTNLAGAGILGGYEDNTIRPLAQLTRGETAAILCRVQSIGNTAR